MTILEECWKTYKKLFFLPQKLETLLSILIEHLQTTTLVFFPLLCMLCTFTFFHLSKKAISLLALLFPTRTLKIYFLLHKIIMVSLFANESHHQGRLSDFVQFVHICSIFNQNSGHIYAAIHRS